MSVILFYIFYIYRYTNLCFFQEAEKNDLALAEESQLWREDCIAGKLDKQEIENCLFLAGN